MSPDAKLPPVTTPAAVPNSQFDRHDEQHQFSDEMLRRLLCPVACSVTPCPYVCPVAIGTSLRLAGLAVPS